MAVILIILALYGYLLVYHRGTVGISGNSGYPVLVCGCVQGHKEDDGRRDYGRPSHVAELATMVLK